MDGVQCINSYPATLGCTGNRHDFSDGTVSGCVNLSEGYFAEEGTCPDGYGVEDEQWDVLYSAKRHNTLYDAV